MDHLINILKELKRGQSRNAVLATIIKVEGSAYRKEGTCMLISAGKNVGMLSAGCLEEELQYQAADMIKNQLHAQVLVYDMSAEDDLGWGKGAGCNGKIHILLEMMTDTLYENLLQVEELIEGGNTVQRVKSFEQNNQWSLYISDNECFFGDKSKYNGVAKYLLRSSEHSSTFQLKGQCFIQRVTPPPRMFIFGAGEDVKPLVVIGAQTGLDIHIWDWRPAKLAEMKQFNVKVTKDVSIFNFVRSFSFKPNDAIIVMTHAFQKDQEILKHIIACRPPSYVGVMGPRNRTARLLTANEMKPIPNLDTPAGAAIGAQGAEEIAVSIMANVIKHIRMSIHDNERRNKNGETDNRYLSGSG
ncbi:XdhC family protein [Virgibacillus halophilus]|uniref:XdhC family protein n=1 Tax=Tigheibacillus halophilus TaxID=361280 RepID=A0ABU5CCG0_9BACI|nr:XdhC family protein [Virgibacillus halophilus]